MTKPSERNDPAASGSSGEMRRQTETLPEQDPAEGSRKTVDHELERQKKRSPEAEDRKSGRQALREQVDEETQLPQKGSA